MNWRERLADWISGGAVSNLRDELLWMKDWRDFWADQYQSSLDRTDAISRSNNRMDDALRAIAAMETPGANGTVKRMARAAREALE